VPHNINNALQVIGGTTELLTATPGLAEPVAQGLRRIAGQNARAAGAISELTRFLRQRDDARTRVNLREIVTRAVALRVFAVGRARLTITAVAPEGGRLLVTGAAAALHLAVLNLIVNAEQALAGRQGGAIRVTVEEPDGQVVVRVEDNGPGVEEGVRGQIFEPFVTTRSRDECSGLGLAVARHVAEAHGGTLTLEASETGALFVMRLPSAG
jgi:C4-dicarboxylate-specific signal transduction histidine kinase